MKTQLLSIALAATVGALVYAGTIQTQKSPTRRLGSLTGSAPRAGDDPIPAVRVNTRDVAPPKVGPRSQDREREHAMPKPAARPDLGKWKLKPGKVTDKPRAYELASFPGPSGTNWVPADPSLAVGPKFLVVVTNAKMTFFDKAGGKKTFEGSLDPADEGNFLEKAGVRFSTFDPRAIYDKESGRFVVTILEEDHEEEQGYFAIAISDDSDPHGNWSLYRVNVARTIGGVKCWADYPCLAFSKDYLWATFNMFDFDDSFVAPMAIALPKAQLYKGEAVKTLELIDTANPDFTMQLAPSLVADEHVFSVSTRSETSAVLHRLRVDKDTVKADQIESAIPEISFGKGSGSAPQPGVNNKISVIVYRMLSSSMHKGKLASIHIGYAPADKERTIARWYEWDITKWPEVKMTQYGDLSDGAKGHSITVALSYNKSGALGMILGSSSKDVRPSVFLTGRTMTDENGSLGALKQSKLSEVSYHAGSDDMRWGDYFGIQPDPVDDETFWGVGQVSVADTTDPANLTTWSGWVASWKVSSTPPTKSAKKPARKPAAKKPTRVKKGG